MRKAYTIPSLGDHSFMGGTRLDNYMVDKRNGKAGQGTMGGTRLDNYMMDKVCELNPMLTKSHTPHKDVFFMHKRVGIWSDNQPITDRDEWQT